MLAVIAIVALFGGVILFLNGGLPNGPGRGRPQLWRLCAGAVLIIVCAAIVGHDVWLALTQPILF